MKQRTLLAVFISCVVFGLIVFGLRSLSPSAFTTLKTVAPLSDPRWTGTEELVLRQTRDGGWALIPVTQSTINQLFGEDYFSRSKAVWSEPSAETVQACRFLPTIELPPGGGARQEPDGSSLWLRTLPPNPQDGYISDFGSREFITMYMGGASFLQNDWLLDPAKLYEKFSVPTGTRILDICESPTQPFIVAVLHERWAGRVIVRFFDALTRVRIGSDLLLADANPRAAGGYKTLRGWTPDGQWVVMTGIPDTTYSFAGTEGFERIWVVSLAEAGIVPAQRKTTK